MKRIRKGRGGEGRGGGAMGKGERFQTSLPIFQSFELCYIKLFVQN